MRGDGVIIMPVYEYRCNGCKRKVTVFVRGFSEVSKTACMECGSNNLTRLISRVVVHKTYTDVYDDILNDRELVSGMMQNDPRALAKWSRKMEGAAGDDIGPEYEEMMDRMERGDNLEDVMGEMQGLGMGDMGGLEDSGFGLE